MSDLTFGIKLTADGKQLTGEVKASRAEFDALNTSVQRVSSTAAQLNITQGELASRLKANADYTAAYKARVEETRAAHEAAAEKIYVVNDSYVKAAGGAEKSMFATQGARRELMVLGHEAMNGNFSRMPGSFMVLAERMNLTAALFNPLTIGAVALGATAIGLGVAFAKGREEMNAMNNALAVTSNYAGLTRGGMESLASSMAASGQITVGTSKDIVTALVASGRIGADAIGTVAKLTSDYARATGQDISKIAPELVKLFADPLKGAEELNRSMHFLTAADMEHIATLEQLGKTQEAQLFLAQKVSDHLPKEAENIGIAAKAWRGLKDAISGTTDALMGIGKTSTVEDELARKAAQLSDQWARTGKFNISTQNEYNALLAQSVAQQEKASASSAAAKKITDENETANLAKQNSELWKKYEINLKIARLTDTAPPEAPTMDAVLQDAAYQLQKKNDGKIPKVKKTKDFDPEADFWDAVDAARSKSSKKSQEQYVKDAASAGDEANKIVDKARIASAEYVNQLQFENSLLGKNALEVQQLTEKRRIDLTLEKELLALRNNDKFKARDVNPEVDAAYQRAVKGAQDAANAAKDGADIELAARDKVTKSWEFGSSEAIRKYNDQVRNSAAQAESLYTKAFKSAEDAVTQFAMTGKLNVRSFGQTVLEEFWRINVSRPMVSAGAGVLGDLFGGMFGGGSAAASPAVTQAGGGMINIPGRASGGSVDPNSFYRVNENGPELLSSGGNDYLMMGGRGGFVTPITSAKSSSNAGTSSNTPSVVVQVINQSGQAVTAKQQGGPQFDGRDYILSVVLEAADTNPHFRNAMGMAH